MDVLRARAFLDLLLGKDSRARQDGAGPTGAARAAPGGFAGRVTLTVPLANVTRLADRPGEIPGSGRSTRGWLGIWRTLPQPTRRPRGASP